MTVGAAYINLQYYQCVVFSRHNGPCHILLELSIVQKQKNILLDPHKFIRIFFGCLGIAFRGIEQVMKSINANRLSNLEFLLSSFWRPSLVRFCSRNKRVTIHEFPRNILDFVITIFESPWKQTPGIFQNS